MSPLHLTVTARVLIPYIIFAALWIYLSDQVLASLFSDPRLLTTLQTYKGLAFIAITAILLYALLRRELRNRQLILDEKIHLRQRILTIVESITDGFVAVDRDWRFIYVNRRASEMLRRDADSLLGHSLWAEFSDTREQPLYHACHRVMHNNHAETLELFYGPWRRWFEVHIYPAEGGISIFFQDISARKRAVLMLDSEKVALEMIARGEPLADILNTITCNAENMCQGTLCSILLLDDDGIHLRHGAAPSLPPDYMHAIDGEEIGPATYPCATAAFRQAAVYVSNISTDPHWENYRSLALQHGLQSCWSTPIRSGTGPVLGTFAIYYRKPRSPRTEDLEMIDHITHVAGIAIERRRGEDALHRQMQMLQALYDAAQDIRRDMDVEQLANHILKKCVADFGASLAWLGSAEPDGRVVSIAHYPASARYMQQLDVRWDDSPQGQGPTGLAIRTGTPQVIENFTTDARVSPWRDAASADGIRSSAAFPLIGKERPIGALNIYAREAGFFTAERVEFFLTYARLVAAKIENARLYERLRDSAAELRRLSQKLFKSQETERHHIARELHDEIGQLLTVIKINLQSLLRKPDTPGRLPLLEDSIQSVDQLVSKVRNLSLDLRPSILDDLGLAPALRWYVQRQTKYLGLQISLQLPDDLPRLNSEIETACFRIVQEAITNAARHAHASHVQVTLTTDPGNVTLTIQDNGTGFDVDRAKQYRVEDGGFGLLGMTERAQLVGGQLDLRSAPEQGVTLTATFPLTLAQETMA
ncbi:MAG: GAF domain-containing protein [Gammaproteobacteria bacterium]